jgi:hypothetical protein
MSKRVGRKELIELMSNFKPFPVQGDASPHAPQHIMTKAAQGGSRGRLCQQQVRLKPTFLL